MIVFLRFFSASAIGFLPKRTRMNASSPKFRTDARNGGGWFFGSQGFLLVAGSARAAR